MKDKLTENNRSKWSKTKIRMFTFVFMTCVFIVAAALLFSYNGELLGKWSEFLSQLCIGAATGCFVVALQETVKDEEDKINQKNNSTEDEKNE